MSEILNIAKSEFDSAIKAEVPGLTVEAERQFASKIELYGIRMTDELMRSFRHYILNQSVTLAAKVSIEFSAYGRLKDMRRLQWQRHAPPIAEMEWFVAKTGLENFHFLNGYKRHHAGWFATDRIAIRRLAWSIAMSRKRFPNVKRKYRGSWYNDSKGRFMVNVRDRLRWRIQSAVTNALKDEYSKKNII